MLTATLFNKFLDTFTPKSTIYRAGGQKEMADFLGVPRQSITNWKARLIDPDNPSSRPMPQKHFDKLMERLEAFETEKANKAAFRKEERR